MNLLIILTKATLRYLNLITNVVSDENKIYVFILDSTHMIKTDTKRIHVLNDNTQDTLVKNNIDILIINTNNITSVKIKNNVNYIVDNYTYIKQVNCFSDVKINVSNKYLICHGVCKISKIKHMCFNTNEKNNQIISKRVIVNNKNSFQTNIDKFAQICMNLLKNPGPIAKEITKNNMKEAVFIEFRILPHSEQIIRNCIHKLDDTWSHTLVCGNEAYDYYNMMCTNIHKNIKIIKLNVYNFSQNKYNNLLLTKEFWNLFNGEKILIYQSDSYIFKSNIDDFLGYDYVGSPFVNCYKMVLAEEQVGNGGLSLRSKSKMLEVLNRVKLNLNDYSSFILAYSKKSKLEFIPEDIFFSQNMQNYHIGNVAPYNISLKFGINTVYSNDCFGMHAMWFCCKKWSDEFMLRISDTNNYTKNTQLSSYIKNNNTNTHTSSILYDEHNCSYVLEKNINFTRKINSEPYSFLVDADTKCIADIDKFVFVLDFHNIGGGATIFLNFIVSKYKQHTNFVIARNYNGKIILTLNDDYIIETMKNENALMIFLNDHVNSLDKIFFNHYIGFSKKFIQFLFKFKNINNKKMYTVTHDCSHICSVPLVTYDTLNEHMNKSNSYYNINDFDEIITQHKSNLHIFDRFILRKDNIKIAPLPDYYDVDNSIKITNTQLVIGIIGNIHQLKGYNVFKKIIKQYIDIQFVVFGIIRHAEHDNVIIAPYNSISELNELLVLHKPNIMLELTISPETYSYTFTLYSIINLPVLILKKQENSVIISRAKELNVEYYMINNEDDIKLHLNVAKTEFNTIKPEIRYNEYWDKLFKKEMSSSSENAKLLITKNNDKHYTYDISVVMAYFNDRKEQTKNTLDGFETEYAGKYNFEVIIVDDNSDYDNKLDDIITNYSFPINLIVISAEEKGDRLNPCSAFNKGFKAARGNIIMIQNPECYHVGNILGYTLDNLLEKDYFSYSCYATNSVKNTNKLLHHVCPYELVKDCRFNKENINRMGGSSWFNHPTEPGKNVGYHFCSALYKSKLDLIGGFDERFAEGCCFDDDELLLSVKYNLQLDIKIVEPDYGFVIHQYHKENISFVVHREKDGHPIKQKWLKNKNLFEKIKQYHEEKQFNYPKLLHLYWDGSPLSYLNLITVLSFNEYHKFWKINVFVPTKKTETISWKTHEQKIKYTGTDYFDKLYNIPNVFIHKIDLDEIGFYNDASEVIKSDYFRYYILQKHGGLWSDFDIIYTASVEDKMNFKEDTVIFRCILNNPDNSWFYYYPVGLFLSKSNNTFFNFILKSCINNYDTSNYQTFGSILFSKLFPNIHFAFKFEETIKVCNNEYYLPFNFIEITQMLNNINDENNINLILPKNNIGIHWFNELSSLKEYALNLNYRQYSFKKIYYFDFYIEPYISKSKKISVVMTYYNRKIQLLSTLKQFELLYANKYDFEVIIVDDNSNELNLIDDIINNYSFKIKLLTIDQKEHNVNPCISYNKGFSISDGDIIVIQNAECYHYTDVFKEFNNLDFKNNYYSSPVLSSPNFEENNIVTNNLYSKEEIISYLENVNLSSAYHYCKGWYNHPELSLPPENRHLHFCSVISKENLDIIKGFDESYCDNYWYDDNELLHRIKKILTPVYLNSLVIHLYHLQGSNYHLKSNAYEESIKINKTKYEKLLLTNKYDFISNLKNKYYICTKRKVSYAVTIYSTEKTPLERINRSILCIQSLLLNIQDDIIFVIDEFITDYHYNNLINICNGKKNVTIYKNTKTRGIWNSKNICLYLLAKMNSDYLCLLDDDIKIINNNISNYIISIYNNLNLSIIINPHSDFIKGTIMINNIEFYEATEYFGNIMVIDKYSLSKYGFMIEFPYKWGAEHIYFTKKYNLNSEYKNICVNFDEYIDNGNDDTLHLHSTDVDYSLAQQNIIKMNENLINDNYVNINIDTISNVIQIS